MSEKPCFINEDELRSRLNGDGKTKLVCLINYNQGWYEVCTKSTGIASDCA